MKFMLKEPDQKANGVALLFWVVSVLGAEVCALVSLLIAVATNSLGTMAIGLLVTFFVWMASYITATHYQYLAAGVVLTVLTQRATPVIVGVIVAAVAFLYGWMNMLALHIVGNAAQRKPQEV